ncbi:hypothetical protein DW915_10480 [Blautia sp. AM42-2]|nr:hypothetical protein DW915_10480 [Blautia sp. AM42-2]
MNKKFLVQSFRKRHKLFTYARLYLQPREAAGRELKQNSIIRTSELIENRRSPCVIDTRGAFLNSGREFL